MLMRSFGSPLLIHSSVWVVTFYLLHNVGLSKTKMPSFSKWGSSEIVTTCLKDSDEVTGVGNKKLKETRKNRKRRKRLKGRKMRTAENVKNGMTMIEV